MTKTTTIATRTLAALLTVIIALFAFTGSAFAATVHGADYYGTGSALESGEVDLLEVEGSSGETVFLTVKNGDAVIAKNLPYTLGDGSQEESAVWTGVATLDIANLNLDALDGTYVVEAYADRAGKELLYSGALYGVYADLPDNVQKLIGTRTVNEKEAAARSFSPAETLFSNGQTYRLVDEAKSGAAGVLHFAYEAYDEATTVDGVVKYTDATGAVVASTKIPGLAYGEKRKVKIPTVVTADNGDMYRTVFFKDTVTAENPGHTSFSVYCTKMSSAEQTLVGFYVATIQMVDENGVVIATDSVNVTGEFIYTAPTTIYKTAVIDASTGESAVVTYKINQSPTIRLSAASDGVLNRARTITVGYTAQPVEAQEVEVTFNLLAGDKRINEEGRTLGVQRLTATADGPTVKPVEQLEANGTKYNLVGDASDYAYTLGSGSVPTVDVYYVPEGYVAPGAVEVAVNYVNFLTGELVESHSYTSDPGENARITISTPASFSANGVDYLRLDGQEADIQHSYYSGIASYTVYYRDKNDTLSSETVINTIRVVYVDGGVTESSTTTTGADDNGVVLTSTGGATADDGATDLQLNSGRTYNVFDGEGDNATLTNESGVDSNTERIEDNETPLASGFDRGGTSSAASTFSQMSAFMVPLAIGVVVVIAAVAALVVLRRRSDEETYGM